MIPRLSFPPVWCCFLFTAFLANGSLAVRAADQPLATRIDDLIAAGADGPLASRSTDAEFLRRISLDLIGVIPTAAETREFLDDTTPDKRAKKIDELLASPDFSRHWADVLSVMLLERRAGRAISDREWLDYLAKSLNDRKPWDQLAREIISADGTDPATRPAIRFVADGGRSEHHLLTLDIARLFLGRNIKCAQCHDHPTISDYEQADYFGLFSYVKQTKVHTNSENKQVYLISDPKVVKSEFQSVFFPDNKLATGPKLLDGPEVEIPTFEQGDEFSAPAQNGFPAVPKFRPRQLLADALATADNRHFVLNSVNRFWFQMLGRGLVHPLDLHHADNAPSHPELLSALADAFVALRFDLRGLLREIALSETYQRSSLPPEGIDPRLISADRFRVAHLKPLSAEQVLWSTLQATERLTAVRETPVPDELTFTFKDYINGRIPAPQNLPELQLLFSEIYGNPAGEPEVEFQPSMGQALFLLNEQVVIDWLQPRPGTLIHRLSQLTDAHQLADELYLSILTRLPEPEERTAVGEYLQSHAEDRNLALAELAWSLLAAAEFRLNH